MLKQYNTNSYTQSLIIQKIFAWLFVLFKKPNLGDFGCINEPKHHANV